MVKVFCLSVQIVYSLERDFVEDALTEKISETLWGKGLTREESRLPGVIDFLNPNDVESIEILKDASATDIYLHLFETSVSSPHCTVLPFS